MATPPARLALVLDLGGVVLELDFPRFSRELGLGSERDAEAVLRKLDGWKLYDAFERGTIAEADFFTHLATRLRTTRSRDELLAAWNTVFRQTVPGVEPLLTELAGKVPLYILSNTNVAHIRYAVAQFPVLALFQKILTSYDLGARKPEPEIYRRMLGAIQRRPNEILFIDDRQDNVLAARAVGLQAELCLNSGTRLREIVHRYFPSLAA
jgi:HAD superfamily hydrolase (TIGR01509 family)